MKIGIIGAGMVGRAFATVSARHKHEVMLSNSRHPETLHSLRAILGVKTGTSEEAARFGDVVLVAIPLKNYRAMPAEALAGKVVIDANNYYPDRDGQIPELDREETTTSELLARHLGKSKIVKALNTITTDEFEREGKILNSTLRAALPIAGDDPEAKRAVANLLQQFGFTTLDAGALTEGRRFQKGTPAYAVLLDEADLRKALAEVNG